VADSVSNCGPTCSPCPPPPPNATAQCVAGTCTITCNAGAVGCGTSCCTATKLSAGLYHSCLVTSNGGAKCWGRNTYGQLGDGTTTARSKPTDVSGLTAGVLAIEASAYYHTCAITTGGGVKCWGYNNYGQLGDGTATTRYTPANVSGLASGVSALAPGYDHTCALTSAGGVKCWGRNNYGQLGDGTTTTRYTPTNVSGLSSGVIAIAAGYYHTCAVTTAGQVRCWGYNIYGQLGDGTTTTKYTPNTVSGITSGATAIATGYYHSCAIVSGGAKCWGYNTTYGQLGDGTTTNRYTPVNVTTLSSGVSAIDGGNYFTCAVRSTGAANCWGQNSSGQVGDGTATTRLTPTAVSGLSSGVSDIATGGLHACALTTAGGVKCWGSNTYGQLGDGTTTIKYTPVDISGG
jgi:alpha-tubulin suppressor-like RCC1 family protein